MTDARSGTDKRPGKILARITRDAGEQSVQLPAAVQFPVDVDSVCVRREGRRLVLEPVAAEDWPQSFWSAFGEMPEGFRRQAFIESPRADLDI
ncbi:MAG: hypothetical protein AAGC60_28130 [Acidobacteriota bacterium]